MDVNYDETAIIAVAQEGNTKKQNHELLKEAKKIWKEIGSG